jgi:hypothetical protein
MYDFLIVAQRLQVGAEVVDEFNNLFIHFVNYEMVESLKGIQVFGLPLVTLYWNASTDFLLPLLENDNICHYGGMTDNLGSASCVLSGLELDMFARWSIQWSHQVNW